MNIATNVPIIGQPQVLAFSINMVIKCACGNVILMSGGPGLLVHCTTTCKRVYRLSAWPTVTGNQVDAPLEMAVMP